MPKLRFKLKLENCGKEAQVIKLHKLRCDERKTEQTTITIKISTEKTRLRKWTRQLGTKDHGERSGA